MEVGAVSLDVFSIVSKFVVMLEVVFNNAIVLELAINEIKSTLALKRRSNNGEPIVVPSDLGCVDRIGLGREVW